MNIETIIESIKQKQPKKITYMYKSYSINNLLKWKIKSEKQNHRIYQFKSFIIMSIRKEKFQNLPERK